MAIGHHIHDRAHVIKKSKNSKTGDEELNQEFINLDESMSFCATLMGFTLFHAPICEVPAWDILKGAVFHKVGSLQIKFPLLI